MLLDILSGTLNPARAASIRCSGAVGAKHMGEILRTDTTATHWVSKLLTGLIPDETITLINADYARYRSVLLTDLGLESLAVMGLVLRIENIFGCRVDYETFDLSQVMTLERVEAFIGVANDA